MIPTAAPGVSLRFYVPFVFVAYAVWGAFFLSVGAYASTLSTLDLRTPLDDAIPLIPAFVWVYDFCYIVPLLAVFAAASGHDLNQAVIAVLLSTVAASVVYLAVPIAYPLPDFGDTLSGRFLDWQFRIDFQPGANKMPSLHVANAFLVWLAVRRRSRRVSVVFFLAAVVISISTLLVKKHLVADVALGVVWAAWAWPLAGFVYRRCFDTQADPVQALRTAFHLRPADP